MEWHRWAVLKRIRSKDDDDADGMIQLRINEMMNERKDVAQ